MWFIRNSVKIVFIPNHTAFKECIALKCRLTDDFKRILTIIIYVYIKKDKMLPFVCLMYVKCAMKLFIHSKSSTVAPFKFRNGQVISSHIL